MKTFNIKIATRTFCALLALDAVLFTLLFQFPSHWSRLAWWIFNCPGYNLGDIIGRSLVHHGVVFMDSSLLIGVGLFSVFIWSFIVVFIVREKAVA